MIITKLGIVVVGLIFTLVIFHRMIFISVLMIFSLLFILEINYGGLKGFILSWAGY